MCGYAEGMGVGFSGLRRAGDLVLATHGVTTTDLNNIVTGYRVLDPGSLEVIREADALAAAISDDGTLIAEQPGHRPTRQHVAHRDDQ